MNARIRAIGLVAAIFAAVTMAFFLIVINLLQVTIPNLLERDELSSAIKDLEDLKFQSAGLNNTQSLNLTVGNYTSEDLSSLIQQESALENEITQTLGTVYFAFQVIQYLCWLNMMFFIQNFYMLVFIKKMGRFFEFPTIMQISDTVMFISSAITIIWFKSSIQKGLSVASNLG